MSFTARDLMNPEVRTVGPEMTLVDLDRSFLSHRVSGFPVVQSGRLVGLVSRSDVVRRLSSEQDLGEVITDYYRSPDPGVAGPSPDAEDIGRQVGARMATLKVADVMVTGLLTAEPGDSVAKVAQVMIEKRIHRLPVTDAGQLVGIISSLDFVRLFAEGRVGA